MAAPVIAPHPLSATGFIKYASTLKKMGVQTVACVSVNDVSRRPCHCQQRLAAAAPSLRSPPPPALTGVRDEGLG